MGEWIIAQGTTSEASIMSEVLDLHALDDRLEHDMYFRLYKSSQVELIQSTFGRDTIQHKAEEHLLNNTLEVET